MYYPCLALEKSTWVAMVTVNSPSVLPLSQDNSNMQKYVQSVKKFIWLISTSCFQDLWSYSVAYIIIESSCHFRAL